MGLGFTSGRGLGFRVSGFRALGFRALGVRIRGRAISRVQNGPLQGVSLILPRRFSLCVCPCACVCKAFRGQENS